MAVPMVYPGQTQVSPLSVPVESVELSGYERGVRLGAQVPNAITALAQGVTTGIQNYNTAVEAGQRQQLNDINIQRGLAENAMQPEIMQAKREAMEAQRLQIAEQVRLKQERDEFLGIFQSGDVNQKVDALTSGRYLRVLSEDQQLFKQALGNVEALVPPQFFTEFRKSLQNTAAQQDLLKQQSLLTNNLTKVKATLESGAEEAAVTNDLLTKLPDVKDIDSLVSRIAFEEAGRYERTPEGDLPRDKEGKRVLKESSEYTGSLANRDPAKKRVFNIIDKDTGKILYPNVPESYKKAYQDYEVTKKRLQALPTGAVPGLPGMILTASEREEAVLAKASALLGRQAPAAPAAAPATQQPQATPIPPEAPALRFKSAADVTKAIASLPTGTAELTLNKGGVDFTKSSPAVFNIAASMLQETVSGDVLKQYAPEIKTVFNQLSNKDSEYLYKFEELTDNILRDDYRKKLADNDPVLKLYTQESVKRRNDLQRSLKLEKERAVAGDLRARINYLNRVPASELEDATTTVSTPEELYIVRNRGRFKAKLFEAHEATVRGAQLIAEQRIKSGQVGQKIIDQLNKF